MTSATVLHFPTVKRVIESPCQPPLWMQVCLLRQALARYPDKFSGLQRAILGRAEAIAWLGDDAPIDRQLEYLRYTCAMLQWHCITVPVPYYVEAKR